MLKRFSSLMLMGLCGAMLTNSLMADEATDNHLPVGVRAESQEEQTAHKEARAQMAVAQSNSKKSAEASMLTAKSVHYTTHPGAYHSAIGISAFGDIELEDGSIWKVSPADAIVTLSWLPTDLIVITPNHTWFSAYDYKFTNQNTGQAVIVNLNLGPIYNGLYTRWITAIDYYYNIVYLNDGSVWNMSAFDSGIVGKWYINDTVIIGVNDSFFSASKPNILINVTMLNFAAGLASY